MSNTKHGDDRKNFSKQNLISEIIRFNDSYGRPPMASEFDGKYPDFPSRATYKKHFGSFNNALEESGFERRELTTFQRKKPLPDGVDNFTKEDLKKCVDEYIDNFGEVPKLKDITKISNYPNKYDFDKLFGGYTKALLEFGYTNSSKFNKYYTDKELEDAFITFVKENGKIPKVRDFCTTGLPYFTSYQDRFGSWNNAVQYYGFDVNDQKTINELKEDIQKLCNAIFESKKRKTITCQDIADSEFCSSKTTYINRFKKELGITLREFIQSIGYDMPTSGFGFVYVFEDGEVTKSKYELDVSTFFRNNQIAYKRNIKYSEFVNEYEGKKDCDYVININNKIWYIEVAGLISNSENKGKVSEIYQKHIEEKIKMLKENNLNYKIIYPSDLIEKPLDEIFNFLINNLKHYQVI